MRLDLVVRFEVRLFHFGLTLGVFNIIPYLGTIIGLAVLLLLALSNAGGGFGLLLVLLVKIVVQNIEGWFLTPILWANAHACIRSSSS